MSEDSNFNKNKPQMKAPRVTPLEGVSTYAPQGIRVRGVEKPQGFGIDERRCGVDFCGSMGKGMLTKEKIETLGNAYGLIPLSFGVNFRKNTEMLSNSSGLSPFCPSGEIYSIKKKSLSLVEGFSAKDGLEPCENSSGLIPLNFDIKPQINADERRCSCIEIEKNELAEKELNISVRSESLRLRGKFPEVGVI